MKAILLAVLVLIPALSFAGGVETFGSSKSSAVTLDFRDFRLLGYNQGNLTTLDGGVETFTSNISSSGLPVTVVKSVQLFGETNTAVWFKINKSAKVVAIPDGEMAKVSNMETVLSQAMQSNGWVSVQ